MIINLTQHEPTPEQVAAGVICLPDKDWHYVKELMTFNDLPSASDIAVAADYITRAVCRYLCSDADKVTKEFRTALVGGAPFLMPALENELRYVDIKPVYAFSRRESIEQPQPDGSVKKIIVFRHIGFVETPPNEYAL